MAEHEVLDAPTYPARWDVGQPVLEMREQSTVRASDDLVAVIPAGTWEMLGLVVRRAPGELDWIVRSSDLAGVTRLDVDGSPIHVRISPKLPDLDLFFLADWAFGSARTGRALLDGRAELAALRSEPAACLLGWYMAEVISFANRWIRRGYVTRTEDLTGRVRGGVDIPRYVTRSIAQARPHVIPCRFAEPSHDTPPNQYLKTGLRQAAALSRIVPVPAARRVLQEMARRGLALFAGVSDTRATALDGPRMNLNGPLRHYRLVVAFTTALLEGTFVSTDFGTHGQEAIMWSLNTLYEETLRNVLSAWPGAVIERPTLRATVAHGDGSSAGSSPVRPDYVLRRADGARLVLDAKYKEARAADGSVASEDAVDLAATPRQRVRVRRSDVYQAVAYSRHAGLRPCSVALLYPVTLRAGEPYPEPLHIEGFDPVVHVVFFDVGRDASRHVPSLHSALDQLQARKIDHAAA